MNVAVVVGSVGRMAPVMMTALTAGLALVPLATFVVMNQVGLSANLMSLGGLAIAIGLMIDGSVVVVENAHARLAGRGGEDRSRVILDAVREVVELILKAQGKWARIVAESAA